MMLASSNFMAWDHARDIAAKKNKDLSSRSEHGPARRSRRRQSLSGRTRFKLSRSDHSDDQTRRRTVRRKSLEFRSAPPPAAAECTFRDASASTCSPASGFTSLSSSGASSQEAGSYEECYPEVVPLSVSEKDRESAVQAVQKALHEQQEKQEEMTNVMARTFDFVSARYKTGNPIGSTLSMKQLLAYEAQAKQIQQSMQQLQELQEQYQEANADPAAVLEHRSRISVIVEDAKAETTAESSSSSQKALLFEVKRRIAANEARRSETGVPITPAA